MVITPPQAQLHTEPATKDWTPPIMVRGAPGTHRPMTAGTHGMGVRTPSAALVAAATVGLAKLEHMPNGGMLTPVIVSCTVAAGRPSIITRLVGKAIKEDGAMPKLHCSIAPVTTDGGTTSLPTPWIPLPTTSAATGWTR
jgi:hypothetical protein